MVEAVAAGLREIAAESATDRAFDTVAFSFGGLVATLMAADHPQLVRRLVLVAPGGLGIRSGRIRLRSPRGITDPAELEQISRHNLACLMLHREASITPQAVQLQSANVLRDRMRNRRLAMTDIVARTLPLLRCTIDVMVGSEDQLYRKLVSEFDAVFSALPGLEQIVRIADAGHWVQYEQADAFNSELLRLLASPV